MLDARRREEICVGLFGEPVVGEGSGHPAEEDVGR